MKKNKTIIAAVVLLLVFMVGGAIAYFTDSETKTNTFTIGNVSITFTEPAWTEGTSGQNIVPGDPIAKNPTITVDAGSQNAYLFFKVEVPCTADDSTELFTYSLNSGWTTVVDGTCTGGKATKVLGYGTASAMTSVSAGTSKTAFDNVTLANITGAQATAISNAASMPITAYGIQAVGLDSADPTTVWGYVNS